MIKDAFFDQLHQAVAQASPHDITIILTDANSTLSSSDRLTVLTEITNSSARGKE